MFLATVTMRPSEVSFRPQQRDTLTCKNKQKVIFVGHHSIVDKPSANGAKGPRFKARWRQEFININCMFCSFEKIKLRLGPTFKRRVIQIALFGYLNDTEYVLTIMMPITHKLDDGFVAIARGM